MKPFKEWLCLKPEESRVSIVSNFITYVRFVDAFPIFFWIEIVKRSGMGPHLVASKDLPGRGGPGRPGLLRSRVLQGNRSGLHGELHGELLLVGAC